MSQAPIEPIKRSGIQKFALRSVLVVAGVLVAWLAVELILRLTFDRLPPGIQGAIQSVEMWPWSGPDDTILPRTPFTIDRDFQSRLPVGLKNFPIHWSDAQFTFNTISLWKNPDGTEHRAGLRTNPPQWPVDVMTYGDSFTFCWTKFEECWVQRLADDQGWHVVNAGNPGTGTTGQLNLLKETAKPIRPALVIWQWYPNDEPDDYDLAKIRGEVEEMPNAPYPDADLQPEGLPRYSALAAILKARFDPPVKKSPYKHFQNMTLNGRLMSIRTNEYANPYALEYPRNAFGIARNLTAQVEGERFLRESVGAKLLIVFIPTKEEAYAEVLIGTLGKDYLDKIGEGRRKLVAQCQQNGWNCLDMTSIFQEAVRNGKSVYYGFDSHLDPVGNQILAQAVEDFIAAKKLLAPRTS